MKHKIAIFHELQPGGARRGAIEFAKELGKKYSVDLYYIDEKETISERKYAKNTFFYSFVAKKWQGNNWKVKLYKDTIELFKLFSLHKKVARKINKGEYKFVFIHGSKFTQAPFLLSLTKIKSIYYCQEPLRMTLEEHFAVDQNLKIHKKVYENINRFIRKKIDKYNMQQANLILANSTFTKGNIFKAYGFNSHVCHMGVDTKVFYPENKNKEFDLLFIGSYDFVDGYPLLKEAFKKIKKSLKTKYITHEDGWIANDNTMRDFYNRSRFTICFGYNEPFGLIPLESMACGTPVIALNEGGYKDSVIHKKTGILVSRNANKIAEQISFFLSNPYAYKKIQKQTRNYILDDWTWKIAVKNFEVLINTFYEKVSS